MFILSGAEDLVPAYRQDPNGSWVESHLGYQRDPDGFWVRNQEGRLVIHEDERDGYRVRRYRPRIAWFNGKGVFAGYLRYGRGTKPGPVALGEQAEPVDGIVAFVTPNPSPANAAFSLDDLTAWYRRLAELRERLRERNR